MQKVPKQPSCPIKVHPKSFDEKICEFKGGSQLTFDSVHPITVEKQ